MAQRVREVGDRAPDAGPVTAARVARALGVRAERGGGRSGAGGRSGWAGLGNAAVARAALGVQPRLVVSRVDDPAEREAEAFAARVVAGAPARGQEVSAGPAAAAGRRPLPGAAFRSVAPAVSRPPAGSRVVGVPAAPGVAAGGGRVGRAEGEVGSESAPARTSAESAEAVGSAVGPVGDVDVTAELERFITGISGGEPLGEGVRERIEPVLGADLTGVRVHTDDRSAAAAAQLRARAFTYGRDIFLGAGESAADLALMAHESTHAVQQGAVEVYRLFDFIDEAIDAVGDAAMDVVVGAAREIPGYDTLSSIIGQDLITSEPVRKGRSEFVQFLVEYGPFAGVVGPVMQAMDVLDDIFTLIGNRLAEHNLTLTRIGRDIAACWDEVELTEGIDHNVRIVTRYVNALLDDVRAFVSAIVGDVIAAVKAAAVAIAEPLVQRPEIKPYWDLGTKVFHHNPLTGESVDAPTVEILGDFLKLIGKEQTLQQMQERGTLQKTADWLDTQFGTFAGLMNQTGQLVSDAWDAITPANLPNIMENLQALARRSFDLLHQFWDFATTVIGKVLELVKDALLGWLSEHAHRVPGFHLMTVILGQNPFTGETVERNATNLIRGFITLLPGGDTMYDQLAESGVIADAAGRIESEMTRLNITWDLVTGTFRAIWDGLSLEDLLAPVAAFERILNQFGEPLSRIISFAGTVVQVAVELILRLMNFPSELLGNIIANAMAAIDDIVANPVGFLINVIQALKQGFLGFLSKIGTYLMQGLSDWLFRGLRGLGIQPPADLSLQSVITLVIQVAGVTEETLWRKLGERIGPERVAQIRGAIDQLGQAWAFVKDVQERGITAVWEFIQGQLTNLWDMLIGKAQDWIMREVIDKVTTRLMSMLDPTGVMAVINSAVAFFDTIRSVVEYIREILEIVDRYVSTLAAVARGDVAPGADMLEHGLAQAIPVALGFLANLLHLDNVPDKIREIITELRELIDGALDWLFDQAMALGRAALEALGVGDQATDPKTRAASLLSSRLSGEHTLEEARPIVAGVLAELQPMGLHGLELRQSEEPSGYEIHASASPWVVLASLMPKNDEGTIVTKACRMLIELTVTGSNALAGSVDTNPVMEDESGDYRRMRPIRNYRGAGIVAGGVLQSSQSDPSIIRALTFNTGDNSNPTSNATHAERQLESFLKENSDIAERVTRIQAIITLSPCDICSTSLSEITDLTPNAQDRHLTWQELYKQKRRRADMPDISTTAQSLAKIRGWSFTGDVPSGTATVPSATDKLVWTLA